MNFKLSQRTAATVLEILQRLALAVDFMPHTVETFLNFSPTTVEPLWLVIKEFRDAVE